MSAIFVSLKPCLTDIERWLPAKIRLFWCENPRSRPNAKVSSPRPS